MLALHEVRDALCLNNINLNPRYMKERKEGPLESEEDLRDIIAIYKGRTLWILI